MFIWQYHTGDCKSIGILDILNVCAEYDQKSAMNICLFTKPSLIAS